MPAKRYISQKLRLNLLRAADAIETQRSILKASAFLGISQPALTKSLQELEDILQLRLFERHPRGVRPTEAGIVFIRSARRMLAELKRLDEELDQVSRPMGGTAALGALPVAAAGVLPGALTRLRALYPAISVRLLQGRTEELLPLLASGEIDLIVGRLYRPVMPDGFVREPLWTEPISILARAGHELFKQDHVTVEDLRRYELVLPTVSQRVGQEIEHLLATLDLTPTASLRSSSYGFIREMLHGSDLLSVMPRLMMVGDVMRGSLRVVALPIPAPDRPAGLILPRGRALQPQVHLFVECLRSYVLEMAERGIADLAPGNSKSQKNDTTPQRRKK
jgi:LysR family transcriptional regulator, pca operon transcriptional activator